MFHAGDEERLSRTLAARSKGRTRLPTQHNIADSTCLGLILGVLYVFAAHPDRLENIVRTSQVLVYSLLLVKYQYRSRSRSTRSIQVTPLLYCLICSHDRSLFRSSTRRRWLLLRRVRNATALLAQRSTTPSRHATQPLSIVAVAQRIRYLELISAWIAAYVWQRRTSSWAPYGSLDVPTRLAKRSNVHSSVLVVRKVRSNHPREVIH